MVHTRHDLHEKKTQVTQSPIDNHNECIERNDEKKIELNKHPDEEADKWDMKTSTRWAEIPDEWTDKSKDLNKHPDEDDLHEKKALVTINPTEIPDE